MGTILETAKAVFRDYETDGVPASGPHKPAKAEIEALFGTVETSIAAALLGSVSVVKDTRANLDADLAHPADTIALVYADATDANNDLYVKTGVSGAGGWTLTGVLHDAVAAVAQPFVDAASGYATDAALSSSARARINMLDRADDNTAPVFIPTMEYTRSHEVPANFTEATIASRDSATQFTVAAGHGNRFAAGTACVLRDAATLRYRSFLVRAVAGDVVTVFGALPATIDKAQTMHGAAFDQHLSRLGYLGLADYLADVSERYAYKKLEPLFAYNPGLSQSASFNTYDIENFDGSETLWPVTRLGTASGGGFVAGTTNLGKACGNIALDAGPAAQTPNYFAPRYYQITDTTIGSGIRVDFDAQGYEGFVWIPLVGMRTMYTPSGGGTAETAGRARLVLKADGATFHDETYENGTMRFVRADMPACETMTLEFKTADAVPSDIRLHGVYGYAKSPKTPATPLFDDDDVIALFMDSWGEYPPAIGGEVLPNRADGSLAGGMQFLQQRLVARLAADNVRATVLNMSRGNQTSEWARYWAHEIVALEPKPTKVVINFAINDANSTVNWPATANAFYDIDPGDMWQSLSSGAGGVFGSVSFERWYANLQWLCDYFGRNGIKPIVLLPPWIASVGQTQNHLYYMVNRLASGFEPLYNAAGRAP